MNKQKLINYLSKEATKKSAEYRKANVTNDHMLACKRVIEIDLLNDLQKIVNRGDFDV